MYLYNEFIMNILNDINTLSCPRKNNSNTTYSAHFLFLRSQTNSVLDLCESQPIIPVGFESYYKIERRQKEVIIPLQSKQVGRQQISSRGKTHITHIVKHGVFRCICSSINRRFFSRFRVYGSLVIPSKQARVK